MFKLRSRTLCCLRTTAVVGMLGVAAMPLSAQPPSADALAEIRRSIDVFSGVLREGLGLNERRGVFSPLAGGVQGHYLAGQGIVLEMITPLRNYRSAASVQSLNSSLHELSAQLGSLMERGVVTRPDFEAMRDTMALSIRSDEFANFYREQMEQLAVNIDISSVEEALGSATASLHGLRNMGELEPEAMARLTQRVQELREELAARMADTEALRQDIREQMQRAASELPAEEIQQNWQQAREQIRAEVAALRDQASEQAALLQARQAALEEARQAQWQQDVTDFESQLYAVLCDYASGLRALPEGEHLTVRLAGLGAPAQVSSEQTSRRDRVHIFARNDLLACQRGDIDLAGLRNRVVSYDF